MMSCNICGFSLPRIASCWLLRLARPTSSSRSRDFNTRQLLEAFPECEGRVAHVPNAAEDLFFEPASSARGREQVRADLGLPARVPYLLSVANFQPRKNLAD